MVSTWIEIIGLCILLLLSAFFSGSEIAIFSANKIRIRKMVEEGSKNALILKRLHEKPNRLLATILVWNNLINVAIASIVTTFAISMFGGTGVGVAIGAATLMILIFGEIIPKALAARYSERASLFVARPISALVTIMYPIVRGIVALTKAIINVLGADSNKPFVTEEEIKMLVEVGESEGVIEKEEREMINGVFKFGDTTAKEVMVPRLDISGIKASATLEEAKKLVLETGYARTPVYDGNIDNIVGFLFSKDLLKPAKSGALVKDIMRQAYYVPETKKLDEILDEMQQGKTQMAIVVDEHGGTDGLITLEDLVEEIMGEILDEKEEHPIKIIDEKTALVNAKTSIDDVNEALETSLPKEGFETLGGLVLSKLGDIPMAGEKVEVDRVTLVVERMVRRRVSRVKVIKN
ncbi:hemolysin family protein [archaeon]|nr:hemolysin family protein [archaeon]